jgi:hypothetical protein
MKTHKKRLRKTFYILLSILIVIPALLILLISPITKYLIEKYSVKYTGRQIRMDRAYVNPFTGYVHFSNLKIFESSSDSIFFSSEGVSASFALRKIFNKTYEISSLVLDNPKGMIVLNSRSHFNFDDLIERFTPLHPDTTSPPLHLNILNMKINNGVFYFQSVLSHVNYFIKDVNIQSTGKRWDVDTLIGNFSLASGPSTGNMKGDFTINFNNLDYRYNLTVRKFSLDILEQYLKDIANYGTFSANLDADLQATGNLKDEEILDSKGRIAINDFHFGKNPKVDYLSFDRFVMAIKKVNPKKHIYYLDSVMLTHPYFKYEQYDELDNLETMFGKMGSNVAVVNNNKENYNLIIEIGQYLIDISKNFFHSEYKINNLELTRGNFQFTDFSQSEEFSVGASPLFLHADSINQAKGNIHIALKTSLTPYGNATIYTSINPRDSADFNVLFHFSGIPISMFNPYVISYTSFPFDRGTINFDGNWKVRDGNIQSDNHLLIVDPHIEKRLHNKADKWIPMRLAMYFVRSSGNVIDFQIPVSGSLKKPKFHLHDVVMNIIKNVFVKPPTTPYRMKISTQERTIEKSIALKWGMRQSSIQKKQERFLKKLGDYLSKNPTSSIVVTPNLFEVKEKEDILFFEAKKKYYLANNMGKSVRFSEDDSDYINKMSIKDPLFVTYLDKHLSNSLIFTIQGKCSCIIGPQLVNRIYNQLNKNRKVNFLSFLKEKDIENRITFGAARNDTPYDGFSFYKITYHGDIPDYLINAYRKMEELNDKFPREKYKKDREKFD